MTNKFQARGITKDNKFVYGYYFKADGNGEHYIIKPNVSFSAVNPDEHGECDCGITDFVKITKEPDRFIELYSIKKEKIFENDKIICSYTKYTVRHNINCCAFYATRKNGSHQLYDGLDIKIIGNTHNIKMEERQANYLHIEEDLPRLYGGSPLDYQILETEDSSGLTRVTLIVSPEVGEINEEELKDKFLELLNPKGRGFMTNMWVRGDTIVVKRDHPIPTKSGKIMPLHIINEST